MFTGLKYDALQEGYEVWVEGQMIGFRVWDVAAQRLLESRTGQPMAAQVEVEPVTVTEKAARGRCPWYRSIRRCYAIFQEVGLPTDDEAMRLELGRLLGRTVSSRRDLRAGDWLLAGDRAKRLAYAL